MGKRKFKGDAGAAKAFVTRNAALRKLQLSLSDFRKLCILKGVYPRDPGRKAPRGKNKTYYFAKDLAFLAHDPLLAKFREFRTLKKKLRSAKGKKDDKGKANRLRAAMPKYTLEHIIRERYPTFSDALRTDLDDALTMVHLFASLPADIKIKVSRTSNCHRLAREFQLYCVRAGALRAAFISIKGFYYQAEIMGHKVTWLVPHQYTQRPAKHVDYRVMMAFLELYEDLVGFVNYKLFSMLDLQYPPTLDRVADSAGGDLNALIARPLSLTDSIMREEVELVAAAQQRQKQNQIQKQKQQSKQPSLQQQQQQRLDRNPQGASASAAAAEDDDMAGSSGDDDDDDYDDDDDEKSGSSSEDDDELNADSMDSDEEADDADRAAEFDEGEDQQLQRLAAFDASKLQRLQRSDKASSSHGDGNNDDEEEVDEGEHAEFVAHMKQDNDCATLFRGLRFFLSREVPRSPLVFVIRAFGGVVSWDVPGFIPSKTASVPFPGYFGPDDSAITHYVSDRGALPKNAAVNREYVQPQWVFDSANERFLLPCSEYALTAKLPPHLSPFVNDDAEGYVPRRRLEINRMKNGEPPLPALGDGDEDDEAAGDSSDEEAGAPDAEELELAAEFAGAGELETDSSSAAERRRSVKALKRQEDAAEDREQHYARVGMMSKKDRRLYQRMQHGIKRKQSKNENLHKKRAASEAAAAKAASKPSKKEAPLKKRK